VSGRSFSRCRFRNSATATLRPEPVRRVGRRAGGQVDPIEDRARSVDGQFRSPGDSELKRSQAWPTLGSNRPQERYQIAATSEVKLEDLDPIPATVGSEEHGRPEPSAPAGEATPGTTLQRTGVEPLAAANPLGLLQPGNTGRQTESWGSIKITSRPSAARPQASRAPRPRWRRGEKESGPAPLRPDEAGVGQGRISKLAAPARGARKAGRRESTGRSHRAEAGRRPPERNRGRRAGGASRRTGGKGEEGHRDGAESAAERRR